MAALDLNPCGGVPGTGLRSSAALLRAGPIPRVGGLQLFLTSLLVALGKAEPSLLLPVG